MPAGASCIRLAAFAAARLAFFFAALLAATVNAAASVLQPSGSGLGSRTVLLLLLLRDVADVTDGLQMIAARVESFAAVKQSRVARQHAAVSQAVKQLQQLLSGT